MIDYSKVEFQRHSSIFHSYLIPGLHSNIARFKKDLEENFYLGEEDKHQFSKGSNQQNYGIRDNNINNFFINIFENLSKTYYILGKSWDMNNRCGIYVQTNAMNASFFHQHTMLSVITGVMYIDPPKDIEEGGELEVWPFPDPPKKILPQKDIVYFFPSWLVHRPLPQKTSISRISINWGYNCNTRPIHKLTGDCW